MEDAPSEGELQLQIRGLIETMKPNEGNAAGLCASKILSLDALVGDKVEFLQQAREARATAVLVECLSVISGDRMDSPTNTQMMQHAACCAFRILAFFARNDREMAAELLAAEARR